MFGVLDGQVEMMVVFVTGGPHVTIVVHVQPQPHQLLDQAPLSQRVRPVLRPGLRLKKYKKYIHAVKYKMYCMVLLLEDTSCNVHAGKYSYSSLSYIKVKNMNISILLNYLDGWFDLNIYSN